MEETHRRAGFWIWLCVVKLWPLNSLLFKLRFRGFEHVPKTGGVLFAVNHISHADWLPTVRYIWDAGRVPRVLIKASLFRKPLLGSILRGAKQIPVERATANASASLDAAVEALNRGASILVYPEGTITRDPDRWPMRSKTGIARLALASGVPVVPIAQWGAQEFYDRGRVRPLPRKQVTYVAGPPVDLSAYQDKPVTHELLREITDVIMTAVREQLSEIRDEPSPTTFYVPGDG